MSRRSSRREDLQACNLVWGESVKCVVSACHSHHGTITMSVNHGRPQGEALQSHPSLFCCMGVTAAAR